MAIRRTERKPLIVPDWYNEKEREMNFKMDPLSRTLEKKGY